MTQKILPEIDINVDTLRKAISEEYEVVAHEPQKGFHFHTGRTLARILGYSDE